VRGGTHAPSPTRESTAAPGIGVMIMSSHNQLQKGTCCSSPRRERNVGEAVVNIAKEEEGDVECPGTARQRVHLAVLACFTNNHPRLIDKIRAKGFLTHAEQHSFAHCNAHDVVEQRDACKPQPSCHVVQHRAA
jgi:hypothetical protein